MLAGRGRGASETGTGGDNGSGPGGPGDEAGCTGEPPRRSGGSAAKDYADIQKILAEARFWLNTRGGAPFFLYLHVMNVHGPCRAPPAYRERFLEHPYEDFPFRNPLWMEIAQKKRTERRAEVKEEHLLDLRARYDGAIAYTDTVLSEFLEDLRTRRVLDAAVLMITSDHGEELFDHGSFGHRRTLYGEQVEVPLLLRLPGGESGGLHISEPVSSIDVGATLLDLVDLLSLQPEERFGRGVSLVRLISSDGRGQPAAMMARLERLPRMPEREAADERRPGVEVPQDGELRRQLDALGYIDPDDDV